MTGPETDSSVALRRRFLAVGASNAADALDEMGVRDQGLAHDLVPFPSTAGPLAGWAFTLRGEMAPYPLGDGDPEKLAACSRLGPGSVSVWSGDAEGVCLFGELIALGMKERGCVGAIVDGGVRDVAWFGRHGFPVYARYRSPVQSIGRWRVTASDVPVLMPGATVPQVQVRPGDLLLADDDGALVIPGDLTGAVLERAEAMSEQEGRIRAELAAGLSLSDALARYGHV
jgi:4-hydroxy-4-methyl-2-oxoglutarate aldolase